MHGATVWAFEGPPDPVDYVHQGSALRFPNRLILPDAPKLAETLGSSSGGISLSVRGRNFRKAVFDRSNLAHVDFTSTDMAGASLEGTKLDGADFSYAWLLGARFNNAIANGTKFSGALLTAAAFDFAQLSSSKFFIKSAATVLSKTISLS